MASANPRTLQLDAPCLNDDTALKQIFAAINKRYFGSRITAKIRWEVPAGSVTVFTGVARKALADDSPWHREFARAVKLLGSGNTQQALPLLIDCAEAGHDEAHMLLNHVLRRLGDPRWENYARRYNLQYQSHKAVAAACYYPESNVIAIHPHIGERKAPQFVLKYLIFHECCHQLFESDASNPHPVEFMEWETRAPGRERALEWLEKEGFPTLALTPE